MSCQSIGVCCKCYLAQTLYVCTVAHACVCACVQFSLVFVFVFCDVSRSCAPSAKFDVIYGPKTKNFGPNFRIYCIHALSSAGLDLVYEMTPEIPMAVDVIDVARDVSPTWRRESLPPLQMSNSVSKERAVETRRRLRSGTRLRHADSMIGGPHSPRSPG